MRHRILPLILVVLLSRCERPPGETPSQPGRQEFFAVNTQLSVAANKKLIDDKETIIVAGNFTGHPKQGTEARYLDIKSGDVVLGDVKKEIRPGETATFDKLNRWLCDKHEEARPGYERFPEASLHSVYGLVQLPHRTASLPWAKA
jgi:hypothetical protein